MDQTENGRSICGEPHGSPRRISMRPSHCHDEDRVTFQLFNKHSVPFFHLAFHPMLCLGFQLRTRSLPSKASHITFALGNLVHNIRIVMPQDEDRVTFRCSMHIQVHSFVLLFVRQFDLASHCEGEACLPKLRTAPWRGRGGEHPAGASRPRVEWVSSTFVVRHLRGLIARGGQALPQVQGQCLGRAPHLPTHSTHNTSL